MAKIKINSLPPGFVLENGKIVEEKRDGGSLTTGDQFDWGLVTVPQSAAFGIEMNDEHDQDVRYSLSAVPRDEANLEAEGGETVLTDLNSDGLFGLYDVIGPRHGSGGVPMFLPEQSFVFSDTASMKFNKSEMEEFDISSKKKKTPADISKKFQLNEYYSKIVDPYTDEIGLKSAEIMLEKNKRSLSKLAFGQEAKKNFEDGVPLAAHPFIIEQGMDPIDFTAQMEQLSQQQAQEKVLSQLPPEAQQEIMMMEQMMQQQAQQQQQAQHQDLAQQPEEMGMPPLEGVTPPPTGAPPMGPEGMMPPMATYGYELPTYQKTGEFSPYQSNVGPTASRWDASNAVPGVDLSADLSSYSDYADIMGLTLKVVDQFGKEVDPNNMSDGMYVIQYLDEKGVPVQLSEAPEIFGVQNGAVNPIMMTDPAIRQATHNELSGMIPDSEPTFAYENLESEVIPELPIVNAEEVNLQIPDVTVQSDETIATNKEVDQYDWTGVSPEEQAQILKYAEDNNVSVQDAFSEVQKINETDPEMLALLNRADDIEGELNQKQEENTEEEFKTLVDSNTEETVAIDDEEYTTKPTDEVVEEIGEDYINGSVSDIQRANLDNAIKSTNFNDVQKVLEANIGNIVDGKAGPTNQPAGTFAKYDAEGELEGDMRSGNSKMGIRSLFPELKANPDLMHSANGELLRMFNVNSSFDPRVAAGIAQGLIKQEDRGKYWKDKTDADYLDINDVEGIDLSLIDPNRLYQEVTDIYKNTHSDEYPIDPATGMSTNYPVWQERIKFMSERHGMDYPAGFTEKGDFRDVTVLETDANGKPKPKGYQTINMGKKANDGKYYTYDTKISLHDAYDPDAYNGSATVANIDELTDIIEEENIESAAEVDEKIEAAKVEVAEADTQKEKQDAWDKLNEYQKLKKLFESDNADWTNYLDKSYAGYQKIIADRSVNTKGIVEQDKQGFQDNMLKFQGINWALRDLANQDTDLGRRVKQQLSGVNAKGYNPLDASATNADGTGYAALVKDPEIAKYIEEYSGISAADAYAWANDPNNIGQAQAGIQGFRFADAENQEGMPYLHTEFKGKHGADDFDRVYPGDTQVPSVVDRYPGDHTAGSYLKVDKFPDPPPPPPEEIAETEEEIEVELEKKKGCPCEDGSISYLCCAKAPVAQWEPWLQDEIKLNSIAGRKRGMYMPWQPAVPRVELDYTLDDPTTQIAAANANKALSDQAVGAFGGRQALAAFTGKSSGEAMDANAQALQRIQTNNVGIKNQYFRDQGQMDAKHALEGRTRKVQYINDVNKTLQNYENVMNFDREQYDDQLINYYTNAANTQATNSKNPYYHIQPGTGGTINQVGRRSFTGDAPTDDLASYQKKYLSATKELQGAVGADGKVTNKMVTDYMRGYAPAKQTKSTGYQYPAQQPYAGYGYGQPNMGYPGAGTYQGGYGAPYGGAQPQYDQFGNRIAKKGKELKKWAVPFYTGKIGV